MTRRTPAELLAHHESKAAEIRKKEAEKVAREKSDVVRKTEAAIKALNALRANLTQADKETEAWLADADALLNVWLIAARAEAQRGDEIGGRK